MVAKIASALLPASANPMAAPANMPAGSGATGVWNSIHWTGRTAIVLVGTGVVVFAGWKGYQVYQEYKAGKQAKATTAAANSDLVAVLKNPSIVLSYPAETYSGWAETIFNLLNGSCAIGYNDAQVTSILRKMRNEADWLKLVSAFGVKTVNNCVYGTYTGGLTAVLNKGLTLQSVLDTNLDLATKGIKSRI